MPTNHLDDAISRVCQRHVPVKNYHDGQWAKDKSCVDNNVVVEGRFNMVVF